MSKSSSRELLYEFLLSSFQGRELRRLIRHNIGEKFAHSIDWECCFSEVVFEVCDKLEGRGLLNSELWEALRKEVPGRVTEIDELCEQFGTGRSDRTSSRGCSKLAPSARYVVIALLVLVLMVGAGAWVMWRGGGAVARGVELASIARLRETTRAAVSGPPDANALDMNRRNASRSETEGQGEASAGLGPEFVRGAPGLLTRAALPSSESGLAPEAVLAEAVSDEGLRRCMRDFERDFERVLMRGDYTVSLERSNSGAFATVLAHQRGVHWGCFRVTLNGGLAKLGRSTVSALVGSRFDLLDILPRRGL